MNILYYAPIALLPLGRGNNSTIHEFISRLRNHGHIVHYVYFTDEGLDFNDLFASQDYVDTLDFFEKKIDFSKNRKKNYYKMDSWYQQGLGEFISKLCYQYKIDIIICTYVMQSKILNYVPKNIIKIIDTHDKMTNRFLYLKQNNIPLEFFSCKKHDETIYLKRADYIWARNQTETNFFNKITKSSKCYTISHITKPQFLKKRNYNSLKKVGIIASYNNINYKMICYLINSLKDNNRFMNSGIQIIIGGNVSSFFSNKKNYSIKIGSSKIVFAGFITNLKKFYSNIDLVIIPIKFGTGINVKTVEALSFGIPIISTKIGSKGIDSKHYMHNLLNINDLIIQLLKIKDNPSILNELSLLSKKIYLNYYSKNTKIFDSFFTKK